MKNIYLVLDDEKIVIDVTETETPYFYCDVEDDVTVEDVKESLLLDSQILKWEHDCLYLVEVIADHDSYAPIEKVESLEEKIAKMEERIKSLETAIHNLTGGVEHEVEIEL